MMYVFATGFENGKVCKRNVKKKTIFSLPNHEGV
jgi:hypothetical protein